MISILHYLNDPKLWELRYIPYCGIHIINRSAGLPFTLPLRIEALGFPTSWASTTFAIWICVPLFAVYPGIPHKPTVLRVLPFDQGVITCYFGGFWGVTGIYLWD